MESPPISQFCVNTQTFVDEAEMISSIPEKLFVHSFALEAHGGDCGWQRLGRSEIYSQ
jgi:hypothetical protein